MLTKIMAAAAVSALALTSAMAQTQSPSSSPGSSSPSSPPAAATPAPATPAPSASATTPAAGKANFVTKQTQDQWLATKFKGTDVIGTNDEKIGDVSDMLFDKEHKIIAYIVGVGGFLGIGQKDVAIAPSSFQMVPASATRSSSGTGTGGSSSGSNTGSSSSSGSSTGGSSASSSNDHDNFKLRLSMTKDELKNAPAFEQYNARPASTSQAPANRPAGGTAPAPKQ